MTSKLYRSTVEWSEANLDQLGHELTLKCWQGLPWMVEAFFGDSGTLRHQQVIDWCGENFGEEAMPATGKPGDWYRGADEAKGWSCVGFKTEEMMNRFLARWPAPESLLIEKPRGQKFWMAEA